MKEVDSAIYSRLSADSTLTALIPGGVWRMVAPEGTIGAYAVFQLASATADTRTFGPNGPAIVHLMYQIKVIEKGNSAINVQNALARIDDLLDDYSLSVTPATLLVSRRDLPLPDMMERLDNEEVYQVVGSQFRIEVVG